VQTAVNPGRGSVKNVLLWDTQQRHRASLMRELGDNYHVLVATDLEQANLLAAQHTIDVALIEVDLPRQNSLSLLKKLHRSYPNTKVIMMTDYGDEELWVDVVNQGASDLVCKPVCRRDLERAI